MLALHQLDYKVTEEKENQNFHSILNIHKSYSFYTENTLINSTYKITTNYDRCNKKYPETLRSMGIFIHII